MNPKYINPARVTPTVGPYWVTGVQPEQEWLVYTYDSRGVKITYPERFDTQQAATVAADSYYRQRRNGGYLHFIAKTDV